MVIEILLNNFDLFCVDALCEFLAGCHLRLRGALSSRNLRVDLGSQTMGRIYCSHLLGQKSKRTGWKIYLSACFDHTWKLHMKNTSPLLCTKINKYNAIPWAVGSDGEKSPVAPLNGIGSPWSDVCDTKPPWNRVIQARNLSIYRKTGCVQGPLNYSTRPITSPIENWPLANFTPIRSKTGTLKLKNSQGAFWFTIKFWLQLYFAFPPNVPFILR